jgi:alkanesulfonate monooxygenase SsuD/methylene tetrahydromethanopterin reductase-like flavin-dependent oxidoreductase (luciferase family)
MIERAAAARDAGLDSLFVGDHHATGAPYNQNVPILGRLLAEWNDKPAGALFLLPLWNPVLVAEQVGTLAAIAKGRFVLQCAIGAGRGQFAAMGADITRRPSTFERSLATIRALLAGDEVDGVTVAPLPSERVDVWIGASAHVGIERAARLGDGFLAAPSLTLAEANEQLDVYRAACAALGHEPGMAVIRRDVHVGADAADAQRVAEPVVARGYRGFDPSALAIGGVAEVTEHFAAVAALGYDEVLVRHLAEDQAEVLMSFERLGEVRAALLA